MQRRNFLRTSAAGIAGLRLLGVPVARADVFAREQGQSLLTDASGQPVRASSLRSHVNYVFHYPFHGTPAFLLDLDRPVQPQAKSMPEGLGHHYNWPGGVGEKRSIVAYSAICPHDLGYPSRDLSFISYRRRRARRGVQDGLIHCCADHSQYDPAMGATVVAGPASQPLTAILLAHDAQSDTLTAYGTVGPEVFALFFAKHAAKLSLGPQRGARQLAGENTQLWELRHYCRNTVQC